MSASFTYTVVTPDGQASGGECDFLVVPTSSGEIGILAGHAHLVALVSPGVLRIVKAGASETLSVGEGLVEVGANSVRLLVRGTHKAEAQKAS